MQLYNDDCLKVMDRLIAEGIKVDLIVTSPPYNVGKEYENKTDIEIYLKWQTEVIDRLNKILSEKGVIAYNTGNYIKNGLVYPLDCLLFNMFTECNLLPRNRIVWTFEHGLHAKKRLSGRYETIMIFSRVNEHIFNLDEIRVPQKHPLKKHYKGSKKGELSGNPKGKNPSDVWNITNVKNNHPEKTDHPCQFPEKLIEKIVKAYSNKNSIVMDPFMGSGTTGVVCENTERSFIGIELNKVYFNIAKERINQHVKQIKLEV
jgi:adenine-specific DNA-methyltransferase